MNKFMRVALLKQKRLWMATTAGLLVRWLLKTEKLLAGVTTALLKTTMQLATAKYRQFEAQAKRLKVLI